MSLEYDLLSFYLRTPRLSLSRCSLHLERTIVRDRGAQGDVASGDNQAEAGEHARVYI